MIKKELKTRTLCAKCADKYRNAFVLLPSASGGYKAVKCDECGKDKHCICYVLRPR